MIFILGNGLLGTWVHVQYPTDTILLSREDVDINYDLWRLDDLIRQNHPDAIINCAGYTNKRNPNPDDRYYTNSIAPHRIGEICSEHGVKLVHISTDCVFSGKKIAAYNELDEPDAGDNYGWTKLQGEVVESPHLTVRCSFVGWPDAGGLGLLAWLHKQALRMEIVMGYANVVWNGVTVCALADYLIEVAYGKQTGLRHVYGQSLSKYELLTTVNRIYGWGARIMPVDEPRMDRTLTSLYADPPVPLIGGFNFEESVQAMAKREKAMLEYLTQ